MTARTPQRPQLMQLLAPVITSQGYDLEDLSVTSAGRRSLIRVTVDGDGGIDLDAVAAISRAISDALDEEAGGAAFAGPYVLEVSSPGVERPLIEPRHWRRAAGRLVTVQIGERTLTARVIDADNQKVTLLAAGIQNTYPFDSLGPGKVEVEFSRPGEQDDLAATDGDLDDTDSGESVESPRGGLS